MGSVTFSDKELLMFKLSLLVYGGITKKKSRTIYKQMIKLLRATRSHQKIIWGPAQHSILLSPFPDGFMCLLQSTRNPEELTLLIRGTNPISANSWIFQDFLIHETHPWLINACPKNAHISKATFNSMEIHMEKMVPSRGRPGEGYKIENFILSFIKRSPGKVTVNITGHSLGGVLASTIALYFQDVLDYQYPELKGKYEIYAYAIAGPTAGNKTFADYCVKRLGSRLIRYANPLDIAPMAWEKDRLKDVHLVFGENHPLPELFFAIQRKVMKIVEVIDYAQPGNVVPVPSGIKPIELKSNRLFFFKKINLPPPKGTRFLLQAAYQHFIPYVKVIHDHFPLQESPIHLFKQNILKSINKNVPGRRLKKQLRSQINKWFSQLESNIRNHKDLKNG